MSFNLSCLFQFWWIHFWRDSVYSAIVLLCYGQFCIRSFQYCLCTLSIESQYAILLSLLICWFVLIMIKIILQFWLVYLNFRHFNFLSLFVLLTQLFFHYKDIYETDIHVRGLAIKPGLILTMFYIKTCLIRSQKYKSYFSIRLMFLSFWFRIFDFPLELVLFLLLLFYHFQTLCCSI